ncbi:MAG: GTP-binding protein [Candidatus Parvarchaeota archaeon]|nr:GTP-binding protein [Candidatus Parvarchaeota archaeon]
MNSLSIAVIGPYKSGKSTLVNKLQQRKGFEGDVSFYSFKYGGKSITLMDTPGDMDAPTLISSVLCISDAIIFCVSPDIGVNAQVGELLVLADTVNIEQGIICITKADISTESDIDALKSKISAFTKGTHLENFDIVAIDINNDQNMADIRAKLSSLNYNESKIHKPFKLFIDNAFESKGMSIAVGNLASGSIAIHTEGTLCPSPLTKEVSINSIQINQEDVQKAEAGDRPGIGIKGVWPWDLPRGVEFRQKGSFKDVRNGKLSVTVNRLYKQEIRNESKLTLICNWQTATITLTNIVKEGETLKADFEADKNFCFDENDHLILINKDLPIRMLRVIGSVKIL